MPKSNYEDAEYWTLTFHSLVTQELGIRPHRDQAAISARRLPHPKNPNGRMHTQTHETPTSLRPGQIH